MRRDEGKNKLFRDPVHGYIAIPEIYCRLFIDTFLFQRLRHIEQTSMRMLYPSARHDRFAHSLGVYYLGAIAFEAFKKNVLARSARGEVKITSVDEESWEIWRHAFRIACLLHDCGHAPFSHTFEKYYDLENQPPNRLVDRLVKEADLDDDETLPDTPHEILGAIMVLTEFRDAIRRVDERIDPVLVARMITGWDYSIKDTDKRRIESCLIALLNGNTIDVDKLDYIIRDTWASGCDNTVIDTQRLLNSVSVGECSSALVLAFEKSALSVIQGVVTARNFLYRWIYSHPKVVYSSWLLESAVKKLCQEFGYEPSKKGEDAFLREIFSIEAIIRHREIGNREFSLLADGDILHYLKKWARAHPDSEAAEYLSRNHSRKALFTRSIGDSFHAAPRKRQRKIQDWSAAVNAC